MHELVFITQTKQLTKSKEIYYLVSIASAKQLYSPYCVKVYLLMMMGQ